MATITVLIFRTEYGANKALEVIEHLTKQQRITLQDAAIVAWPENKKKPDTKRLSNLTGTDAPGKSFWELLFGLIFPVTVNSTTHIPDGYFVQMGIDENFIRTAREKITQSASALFLITDNMVLDTVTDAIKNVTFELISSTLSKQQEAQLKATFAQEKLKEEVMNT